MILWLRVRKTIYGVITSIVSIITVISIGHLPVPVFGALRGLQFSVPLGVLLPILIALFMAYSLQSNMLLLEHTSYRHIKKFDMIYIFIVCLIVVIICFFTWILDKNGILLVFSRNTIGYIGLVLVGRRIIGGSNAAVLPVSFVILVSIFGVSSGMQPYWWAWPLIMPEAVKYWNLSWVFAVVTLAMGLFSLLNTNFATMK